MGIGLKAARETVTDAASKLSAAASDTRSAVVGVAVLAGLALLVGVIALVIASRGRKPVTA